MEAPAAAALAASAIEVVLFAIAVHAIVLIIIKIVVAIAKVMKVVSKGDIRRDSILIEAVVEVLGPQCSRIMCTPLVVVEVDAGIAMEVDAVG